MTLLAHITDERRGGLAVARVDGDIDTSTVQWVGSRLRALLTNHSDGLVVDLSATTYLDSAVVALAEDLRQRRSRRPWQRPAARTAEPTGVADNASHVNPEGRYGRGKVIKDEILARAERHESKRRR